ncbi:MAG: penicillin-binding protein 2 [Gammaproteobacteria bacterium]
MPRTPIRNSWLEHRQFTLRVLIVGVLALLLLLTVAARLYYLQVLNHSHYVTLAEGNRLRSDPVTPPRGLIYDRNGVLLAENRPSYELDITPEQVPNLKATLAALAKVVEIRPQDLKQFDELLKTKRPFQPLPIRGNLSDAEVARFAAVRQNFPGVDIRATLSRYYPLGPVVAHLVGYTGIISQQELATLDPAEYTSTSQVGKIGIEGAYESLLRGSMGTRVVETDAQGRAVRTVSYAPPVPGDNLYLSVDVRLQEVAEQALGSNAGAVVAIDPRNGQVLALVSTPSFDPNLFVQGISSTQYDQLNNDPQQPLFNRAMRGQYPAGSTIKPFLALAALNYNVLNPFKNLFCPGYLYLPHDSHPYRDWKRGGHGWIDMPNAITQSCDVYFYNVALKLGIERIHQYLTTQFGFGEVPQIDLIGARAGVVPSPQWKRATLHQPWYLGDLVIIGIGQGYLLVTPLQLADGVAAISMHGERFVPRVLRAIGNPLTGLITPKPPDPLPPVQESYPNAWNIIIGGMQKVVSTWQGTAYEIGIGAKDPPKYSIAGKTGTAQVHAKPLGEFGETPEQDLPFLQRDDAWFIAFAPVQDPKIAVAVEVDHGGGGAQASAPIARKVMDEYLLNENHDQGKQP